LFFKNIDEKSFRSEATIVIGGGEKKEKRRSRSKADRRSRSKSRVENHVPKKFTKQFLLQETLTIHFYHGKGRA